MASGPLVRSVNEGSVVVSLADSALRCHMALCHARAARVECELGSAHCRHRGEADCRCSQDSALECRRRLMVNGAPAARPIPQPEAEWQAPSLLQRRWASELRALEQVALLAQVSMVRLMLAIPPQPRQAQYSPAQPAPELRAQTEYRRHGPSAASAMSALG
jgi:hypothetical protein